MAFAHFTVRPATFAGTEFMKILIIQTAFIGDVVLATALIESLHRSYPKANIDFLVRKGNESLLKDHPKLRKVLMRDKKDKYVGLAKLLLEIRKEKYNLVVNCHRFASSGLLTAFSGADKKLGFSKNPFSVFFSKRFPHQISNGFHETQRNHVLIEALAGPNAAKPRLYPTTSDYDKVATIIGKRPYVCMAPTSVWFTKQWPADKWVALIKRMPSNVDIFLLGGKGDVSICSQIAEESGNSQVINLAGKCSLLESAALMKGASMNYVLDSGPLHLASAMNAPVTAIFCSTVPDFGFGPLSDVQFVVQTTKALTCRPCGLHGKRSCPLQHFDCAASIDPGTLRLPETVGI